MPLEDNNGSSIILLGRCNKLSLYSEEVFVLIKTQKGMQDEY